MVNSNTQQRERQVRENKKWEIQGGWFERGRTGLMQVNKLFSFGEKRLMFVIHADDDGMKCV